MKVEEWRVSVTDEGGVALTLRYADGGHVYQLTPREAESLARKLRGAACKCIGIRVRKEGAGE